MVVARRIPQSPRPPMTRAAEPFLPQEIIRHKRDGGTLTADQMTRFIQGIADETVTDGQAAAFAMAVLFRPLPLDERIALTGAMTRSGTVLDWTSLGLDGPALDKHSSGGVGDKVSLLLGPLVAACGGFVPMISGRGLGHTGGTLDKFDAIPGYVSQPELDTLVRVVREVGCAIVGATREIAPADRRLYAIRDVTGTVESRDLITASILSKKLAAGVQSLILDVKVGNGAFADTPDSARALAESLVTVGNGAGMATRALMTDMNQVLGHAAGNAVEVAEAAAILTGTAPDPRLWRVTRALTTELLLMGGLAEDAETADVKIAEALSSGRAAETFGRMVAGLGGPNDFIERPSDHLPAAPVIRTVEADRPGIVAGMDTRAIGLAVIELGGGRRNPTDRIDHSVGFTEVAGDGDHVGPGDRPLALVHAADEAAADRAAEQLRAAMRIGDGPPTPRPLILDRL